MHLFRAFALFCCILAIAFPAVAGAGESFTDELDTDLYDCTLTLTSTAHAGPSAMVRTVLESAGNGDGVLVSFAPKMLFVAAVHAGKKTVIGQAALHMQPGATAHVTIQRRGTALGILLDDVRIFHASAPRGTGSDGSYTADAGWTVSAARAQRLEPVVFADNFMRSEQQKGEWATVRGDWMLQSAWDSDPHSKEANHFNYALYAQNPFAWVGKAADGPALCWVGRPSWEDYTMTAAVCPGKNGAAGLVVNMPDAGHGLLVRWSALNDHGAGGDRLTLARMADGKQTVLAEDHGGFIPGQWYKITVISSLGTLRVLVDGRERLAVKNVTPWRGAVGLYSEDRGGTVFDDVTVYGRTLNTDLIFENAQEQIQDHFLQDWQGMKTWSTPTDWYTTDSGCTINRHDYYGDQRIVATFRPSAANGTLGLVLNGNGRDEHVGYRAVLTVDIAAQQTTYQLFHDAAELAKATGPLLDNKDNSVVRFRHTGTKLALEIDGETALEAVDGGLAAGLRPAYQLDGCFKNLLSVSVLGPNYRDYTFNEEPADWFAVGTWLPTIRWSCQPKWSFYSGWSRGDAILWHKERFSGDQAIQVYLGYKMETPREREIYDNPKHFHDICLTICGDGRDPRSGYTILSGQPNQFDRPSSQTILLRNGVPVQHVNASTYGRGISHRAWFNLDLRKRGNTVEFWLDNALLMAYDDPHPIASGSPAIWTHENGISIARVRLWYAKTPQPRNDPQAIIDTPWYPEWMNLHQPLALAFPQANATSGKPVALKLTTCMAPDGATPPVIKDRAVTFTPTKTGEYWYQFAASDGSISSPPFHLSGRVFDPSLGRDDSHAILLYRFNEGSGAVVHDRSKVAPVADLQVPPYPNTHWVPGHGLTFSGPLPLKTAGDVDKLMTIAHNKACTLEFWVSNDTAYFPNHWLGCLLSWEQTGGAQNLLVGGHMMSLVLAPHGGLFNHLNGQIDNWPSFDGSYHVYAFRTSLQHIVITWDGTNTLGYSNGTPLESQAINWHLDQWATGIPLLLGNRQDGEHTYLGTYYLVAIHDKCFTADEVKRHYLAGPSAGL